LKYKKSDTTNFLACPTNLSTSQVNPEDLPYDSAKFCHTRTSKQEIIWIIVTKLMEFQD